MPPFYLEASRPWFPGVQGSRCLSPALMVAVRGSGASLMESRPSSHSGCLGPRPGAWSVISGSQPQACVCWPRKAWHSSRAPGALVCVAPSDLTARGAPCPSPRLLLPAGPQACPALPPGRCPCLCLAGPSPALVHMSSPGACSLPIAHCCSPFLFPQGGCHCPSLPAFWLTVSLFCVCLVPGA